MSEVALLLANTDRLQRVEDYVSCCTTSSKYWPTSTGWSLSQRLQYFLRILTEHNRLNIMSEVTLLLANTDRAQSAEDYVRGCTTSTKYWPPSTSWRLCQTLQYFYGILTTSTGWRLYQRLHYFYQILTTVNKLKIMSEVVLLLANTDRSQQFEDYVRGCTTSIKYWRFQQVEDNLRGCTICTKYWPTSTVWRLCQRMHYF